jgi:hypothetical protein
LTEKKIYYQKSNAELISINDCNEIKKSRYYSIDNNYITYSNPKVENNTYRFDQKFVRTPKIIGELTVGNKSIYFTDKQIFITREGTQTSLSITDYSALFINTESVASTGEYMPTTILLNHPDILDCINNCSQIRMKVEKLGNIGENAIISLSGEINGTKIKGRFEQILIK